MASKKVFFLDSGRLVVKCSCLQISFSTASLSESNFLLFTSSQILLTPTLIGWLGLPISSIIKLPRVSKAIPDSVASTSSSFLRVFISLATCAGSALSPVLAPSSNFFIKKVLTSSVLLVGRFGTLRAHPNGPGSYRLTARALSSPCYEVDGTSGANTTHVTILAHFLLTRPYMDWQSTSRRCLGLEHEDACSLLARVDHGLVPDALTHASPV